MREKALLPESGTIFHMFSGIPLPGCLKKVGPGFRHQKIKFQFCKSGKVQLRKYK
jgi:hypothetical protein